MLHVYIEKSFCPAPVCVRKITKLNAFQNTPKRRWMQISWEQNSTNNTICCKKRPVGNNHYEVAKSTTQRKGNETQPNTITRPLQDIDLRKTRRPLRLNCWSCSGWRPGIPPSRPLSLELEGEVFVSYKEYQGLVSTLYLLIRFKSAGERIWTSTSVKDTRTWIYFKLFQCCLTSHSSSSLGV